MKDRPTRHPEKRNGPTINPHPDFNSETNWQYVYAGYLADGRAIIGGHGVYALQVQPPLTVTDDGLTIDLSDVRIGTIMSDHHDMLNGGADGFGVHDDTEEVAAADGKIIVANNSDNWDALAAPTASQQLLVSDTSVSKKMGWGLAPAQGDLLYGHDVGAGVIEWTKLPKGNDDDVLTMNGNEPNWEAGGGGGVGQHNLLDGGTVHLDTTTDGVTRGSLIYGNATPKWDEFVMPAVTAGSGYIADIKLAGWDGTDFISWALSDGTESNADQTAITFETDGSIIQAYISDDDLKSATNSKWAVAAVVKVHFKGDQTVTGTTVDSNDWRDRGVEVWGWPTDVDDEFNTDAELQQNDNKDGGPLATLQLMYTVVHTSSDEDTYLISNSYAHAAGTIYISANNDGTGDFVEAELYTDASDSGKLKMDFTHSDPGDQECEGFFILWVYGTAKTSTVTKTTVGNGH